MKTLDFTKLNEGASQEVVNALQQLLADFQVFYTNLRGFHWNVKGKDFFVLHSEYEKLYDNAAEKIDEIAERILMLNGVPLHNFSDYLKLAKVKESGYVTDVNEGLKHIMDTYGYFIESEREILALAAENKDDVTVAIMTDYIKEQEKMIWMLVSYYSK